jgi:hypothetical protein
MPLPGTVPMAGTMPLRRLSRTEYENTVRALLRLDPATTWMSGLPDDALGPSGFDLAGPVGEVDGAHLQDAAESLTAIAVRALDKLLPCAPAATGEDACARQFIDRFGRRAFRRPLEAAETTALQALYNFARRDLKLTFPEAIGHLLTGMLQAPQLVYRWELGPRAPAVKDGLIRLGPHELASRLSYFLWSSMPDDALFQAVDDGKLATADDVLREARRMLAAPAAQATLASFHRQWLHLRDYLTSPTESAMDAETLAFVKKVFAGGGKLDELLTSSTSFVNSTLAPIYGLTGVNGSALVERALDPAQRFGLLTQASFLSVHSDGKQSHPIKRGNVIYRQVLCGELPPQPNDVPPPKPPRTGVSNRERFSEHAQQACARGCHSLIDPLGFGLENYDGTGRFRADDGGKPVDASGVALFPGGRSVSFQNARELVSALATSDEARGCMVVQWLRFTLARRELPEDAQSVSAAAATFARAGYDLRELLVAITQTRSFLFRSPSPGEGVAP